MLRPKVDFQSLRIFDPRLASLATAGLLKVGTQHPKVANKLYMKNFLYLF